MTFEGSTERAGVVVRVLLVDDQPAMLRGLQLLIDGEIPHMRVVGTGIDRREALLHTLALQPDVVVLDLDLAGDQALDFLPELLTLSPARVLVFTGSRDADLHARALREGATAVVSKEETADVLLKAIHWTAGVAGRARPLFHADAGAPGAMNAERSVHPAGDCGQQ
jgi:DNA-binding NarL/FixJ family response regulator